MYKEYKKGTIIRLKLNNFQTYSNSEFSFNPHLNFIAGPNGSGKSSIANAIAFLFGGTPKTLGKAKHLSDYVKNDTNSGYIEATIKLDSDNKICVIKKTLNKHNNQSTFFIDDKITLKSDFESFINKLKIDVDNYCQFLPQEKVSEFAKLGPEELLIETINVINDESLNQMKLKLADLEDKKKERDEEMQEITKKKTGISIQVNNMLQGVEKYKEKKEKENKIRLMKLKIIWISYKNKGDEINKLIHKIGKNEKTISECKSSLNSSKEQIEKLEECEKIKKYEEALQKYSNFNMKLKSILEKIKFIDHEQKMLDVDKNSLIKKKEQRDTEIVDKKMKLTNLQDKLRDHVVPEVKKKDEKKMDEKIDLLEEKNADLDREVNRIKRESSDLSREIKNLDFKLKEFSTLENRKLESLKNYHKDTHSAVLWLRKNKHLFKEEIIEPPFLHIKVKNPVYTAEIETFLGFFALTPFICKNSEDFEKFMKMAKDENKWGVNAVEKCGEFIKLEISREEIKKIGFDGYLTDYIDAREEIINFLSSFAFLSSIPVTKNRLDETKIIKKYNFKKMAIANKYIEIKYNKYNKSEYVIIENSLFKKGYFDASPQKEIAKIEDEFNLRRKKREQLEISLKNVYEELQVNKLNLKGLYEEKVEYKSKLAAVKRAISEKENIKFTINNLENVISELEKMYDIKLDEANLKKKELDIAIERKEKLIELETEIEDKTFYKNLEIAWELSLELRDIKSSIEFYKKKIVESEIKIKETKSDIEELRHILKEKKKHLNEIKEVLKNDPISDNDSLKMVEIPDTAEELEKEILEESVRLKFYKTDNRLLKEFEMKENLLNDVKDKEFRMQDNLGKLGIEISLLRKKITGKINNFVDPLNAKFQSFFDQLSCEGKIEFQEKDLVSNKWRLNIFVKFRKNEKLELLSSFRQSGGEKSVTTILFLLSLQNLIPAPFRLVDEINQGMDRYNEKKVHDILVSLSSDKNSPQFFIITPKIVPDLTFSENMKVIILYSGAFKSCQSLINSYKLSLTR